jgi:hypothetical protein
VFAEALPGSRCLLAVLFQLRDAYGHDAVNLTQCGNQNSGIHFHQSALFFPLQSDVVIPLQPDSKCLETWNEIFEAVNHYLQEPVLHRLRKYLTATRLLEYCLPQNLEQVCMQFLLLSCVLTVMVFCCVSAHVLSEMAATAYASFITGHGRRGITLC